MKDKKRGLLTVGCVAWLLRWASAVAGLVAVLSLLLLGSCVRARAAQQAASVFLLYDVQTDRVADIWHTVRQVVDHLSQGPRGTHQVGATRLWTSRHEYYPCVCWPVTNPAHPPISSCLSMATLDHEAHPCTPYHPATDGWVKRPMEGLRYFSGNKKTYWFSGFSVDLDLNQNISLTLEQYENHGWVDRSTEAVVLEAALYEPHTACIMYMQLGLELDPSRLWRGTTTVWATCEECARTSNWISALLRLAVAIHMMTLILDIPFTSLRSFFVSTLPRPAVRWPSKTLLLNLAVLGMYWAVVVTEIIAQNHLERVWQVPREGKSVFPTEIAVGVTDVADTFTLLLAVLALLLAAQVCAWTFSELGPAVVRLVRLMAIVAVIMVPFSVALYQLGPTVTILSTVGDSVLAVIAAFLGEIDATSLLATTHVTGLVMFFLLFTVFSLLLLPFVVEMLTFRPGLQKETPRSPQLLFLLNKHLTTPRSTHSQH